MRNFLFRGAACVAAVGLHAALAASAIAQSEESTTAPDERQLVATVNGAEIHLADVMHLIGNLPEQYRHVPLELIYAQAVSQLIDQRLAADAARADNYLDDPEIQARLAFVEQRTLQDLYLTRAVEAGLTEERLRARYEERLRTTPPAEEIHARHILVETQEQAEAIIVELAGGADFAELAKTHSIGPSGTSGGDLGFFTKDRMVPEFAEAAFALETGSHSQVPVQTSFGWHVIRIEERRALEPPSFEASMGELRNEEAQKLVAEILGRLRDGATIQQFDLTGAPVEDAE